jgi:hypothetical protein
LYLVRGLNSANAFNSSDSANTVLIRNEAEYEAEWLNEDSLGLYGSFCAKYPGALGNGLKVSICTDATSFANWAYNRYFDNAPGTSDYALNKNGGVSSNDEMHIVVIDGGGKFSSKAGTVLEKFEFASKAVDAIDANGQSSYYKNVLMRNSYYVYAIDHPSYSNTHSTWGTSVQATNSFATIGSTVISLSRGADGDAILAANLISGWDHFMNKDQYEISLAFAGATADITDGMSVVQYVLDNIILGETSESPTMGRRDTMLFISPHLADVKQQRGMEVDNIVTGLDSFLSMFDRSSSYVVVDSGWKYQYDKYNLLDSTEEESRMLLN